MTTHKTLTSIRALSALIVSGLPAAAPAVPPEYAVTNMGALGDTQTRPNAINNLGQITGSTFGNDHSFFWEDGVMIDIGTLGGPRCWARGMNNLGEVTGQSHNASGYWHAFLWDKNNGMTDLGKPSGYLRSIGRDANDAGQVVGHAYVYNDADTRAFVWDGGEWIDLGTLGGSYSAAKAINNLGHAVGWAETSGNAALHAAFWRDGEVIDLGPGLGLVDINDSDQILGNTVGAGILWESHVTTDLGSLGGSTSKAFHMNNPGQIVGWSDTSQGDHHAFLWENGVMFDLNDLIQTDLDLVLTTAVDINDAGWIVARGLLNGEDTAFLLTPVDGIADCNTNGVPDDLDIAGGTSVDCNNSDVPDECELISEGCPYQRGDVNNDGRIDRGDMLHFVLVLLGKDHCGCSVEAADVNADGRVDFLDIRPFVALVRCNLGIHDRADHGVPVRSLLNLADELGVSLDLRYHLLDVRPASVPADTRLEGALNSGAPKVR